MHDCLLPPEDGSIAPSVHGDLTTVMHADAVHHGLASGRSSPERCQYRLPGSSVLGLVSGEVDSSAAAALCRCLMRAVYGNDGLLLVRQSQASSFATNNIILTMGSDFQYENANEWFKVRDDAVAVAAARCCRTVWLSRYRCA